MTTKTIEEQSYDDVPYEGKSFSQTHIRHLYTVGKLFGLNPTDITNARVLELGCAVGGNLFPQAQQYPNSDFLGIDISGTHISAANNAQRIMGLKNISFQQKDITKLTAELGTYDYIITHGVLSWVPDNVRTRIFEIYKDHLSENGLGFISYNTLPGWNMVRSIRDGMLYHANRFDEPKKKITQSKAFLKFLSSNLAEDDPYRNVIDQERLHLDEANDSYVFHEYLESENHQYYFHQFDEIITEHNLRYVGDAEIPTMYVGNLPVRAANELDALGNDIIHQEQYMDFLTNRRFRNSIVTHKDLPIKRSINSGIDKGFKVTTAYEKDEDHSSSNRTVFKHKTDALNTFEIKDSLVTKILMTLPQAGQRPIELEGHIKLICDNDKIAKDIYDLIQKSSMELVMKGFLLLHSDDGQFVDYVSDMPLASPWARFQASQPDCRMVTNTLGANIKPDEFSIAVLKNLNGLNDVNSITAKITDMIESGKLIVKIDGINHNNSISHQKLSVLLNQPIKNALNQFAETALLIG